MIDFNKAYCSLHPHELVTNFCNKEECLTPLCANCICTHTDSHVEKGTSPDYENIRTTYKKIQTQLQNQIGLFEGEKQKIIKISAKIQEKRRKLKQVIGIARQQLHCFIRDCFEQKEKKMMREIQNEQKKRGLHCQNRLQQMNTYVSRQITSLISATEDLTSQTFLESMPRIRTQVMGNAQVLYREVSKQINENENFTTTLTYDSSYLNIIENMIEKSIQLVYSRGIVEQKPLKQSGTQNLRTSTTNKVNRNAQSQVTLAKPKLDQSFNEAKNIERRFSNANIHQPSFPKENKIRPHMAVRPPPQVYEQKKTDPKFHFSQNGPNFFPQQDPKISLLKVSEDWRQKNTNQVNQNHFQKAASASQIEYTLRKKQDMQSQPLVKKGKKMGLKVVANTEMEESKKKLLQTQMI